MKKHATLTMQFNWYSTSQTSWECMQRGRPASSLDTDNLIIKATSILRAWCLLRLFSPRSSIPDTKGKKDDGSHDCFAVLRWMHFSTNITVHSKKQSLWCSGIVVCIISSSLPVLANYPGCISLQFKIYQCTFDRFVVPVVVLGLCCLTNVDLCNCV